MLISGDALQASLEFQRDNLLQEPLRIISGHLVHIDFSHWLGNAVALGLILGIFHRYISAGQLIYLCVLLATSISLLLLAFHPDVHWYRGMSGILHGLAAWGCCAAWNSARRLMSTALLGLCAKLIAEQTIGSPWSSFPVIHAAHGYGAAVGLLAGVATAWYLAPGQDVTNRPSR